jgi:hypothetical protein
MQRGIAGVAPGLMLVAVAALIPLVSFGGGCVADGSDGGILVLKNVHADTNCMTSASETETAVSSGNLDLLVPGGYLFIAQLKSRITAVAGQEDQRTIITRGANIDIGFPDSQLFTAAELADLKANHLTHFMQPFAASLAPNGGLVDAPFELISADLAARIAAKTDPTRSFSVQAVATFTVVGDLSGQNVSSQAFTFPVTIGNKLTVNLVGTCPLAKGSGTPRAGYACNLGQDGIVDCCGTLGGPLTCPAIVSTM